MFDKFVSFFLRFSLWQNSDQIELFIGDLSATHSGYIACIFAAKREIQLEFEILPKEITIITKSPIFDM